MESMYDEFGNYIGPELDESEEVRSDTTQQVSVDMPGVKPCLSARLDAYPKGGRAQRGCLALAFDCETVCTLALHTAALRNKYTYQCTNPSGDLSGKTQSSQDPLHNIPL